MNLFLLVLYNLGAVAVAGAGLWLEQRGRQRLGVALLFVALLLVLNLFVGGALLFVPVVLAIYGTILGLPALGVWILIRRLRRG